MRVIRLTVMISCVLALGLGAVTAKEPKNAPDPAQQAQTEAWLKAAAPGEEHQALAPLVGTWNYTMTSRMEPDGQPQTMTGVSSHTLIFGGRFLTQEVSGQSKDQPPFEGIGITGYDNMRKEYQTVWIGNMSTGMMTAVGQFDPASKTFSDQGEMSCPLTGETHRRFRSTWKVVDPDHLLYEGYMKGPDGKEFKHMEIAYNRAQ